MDVITSHRYTLAKCLEVSLRVLAPITPYLCDELYSKLTEKLSIFDSADSIMQKRYPSKEDFESYRKINLELKMEEVIKVILSIRALIGNVNKKDCVEGT